MRQSKAERAASSKQRRAPSVRPLAAAVPIVILLLLALLATTASAATWAVQEVKSPTIEPTARLLGVSCSSSEFCTAVGSLSGPGGEFELAELWNGKEWSARVTKTSADSVLKSVSCPSEWCMGVGYLDSVFESVPRTVIWSKSGSTGEYPSVPLPKEAQSPQLLGVSCTSSESCLAVGSYVNAEGKTRPLGERWNGKAWTVQEPPSPAEAETATLTSVSCTSSEACTAMGHYNKKGMLEEGFAERWNGKEWTLQAVPKLALNTFAGVSCATATACLGVGFIKAEPFAERWNGKEWISTTTVSPKGAAFSNFLGVSCATSESCLAVGRYVESSGKQFTLGEIWNGKTWTLQPPANPEPGSVYSLDGVSCVSTSSCVAVGHYTSSGKETMLSEKWNGKTWSVQEVKAPEIHPTARLLGVSCSSSESCTGVGSFSTTSSEFELAELWNGKEWSSRATDVDAGSTLRGVSCPGEWCMAVGSLSNGVEATARSVHWAKGGGAAEYAAPPAPKGALNPKLAGVSCVSSESCIAVGSYSGESKTRPLAERWSGTTWTLLEPLLPTEAETATLTSVSCSSSEACTAVGFFNKKATPEEAFAERWNGKEWSLQALPSLASSSFLAVSCAAAEACTSVGALKTESLGEHWNGKAWSSEKIPSPAGSTASTLMGVSCASSTACIGVGDYLDATSKEFTLGELWNGKEWTLQTPANPEPGKSPSLTSVSCLTSELCFAVGRYTNGAGIGAAFAEKYS